MSNLNSVLLKGDAWGIWYTEGDTTTPSHLNFEVDAIECRCTGTLADALHKRMGNGSQVRVVGRLAFDDLAYLGIDVQHCEVKP
jgi:hypothetical protein